MIKIGSYDFDILSDMFITGADQTKAELRVPEIRGVLRWWFRVLGGFKSDSRTVKEQERMIFGSVHSDGGRDEKCIRSSLILRVEERKLHADKKEANDYFLFPLHKNARGYFRPTQKAFTLNVLWDGVACPQKNLEALITVFGNLGSLGMRTRRCYGAIAFSDNKAPMSFQEAFSYFKTPDAIEIKAHTETFADVDKCIQEAKRWLQGWRAVGPSNNRNKGPGKDFAWRDHEIGRGEDNRPAVRPALGMPIVQKYSSGDRKQNTWNMVQPAERFASPVILRPFMRGDGRLQLLAIFVECYKWQQGEKVKINSKEYPVSLELYDAMKNDSTLIDFTF